MPDWFYRTLSRPLLFRLRAARARDLALGFMGTLARLPLGPAIIDLLGHMHPDRRLRCTHLGVSFPGPLGLGPGIDGHEVALPALARFGFGFLEVGPVRLRASPGTPDPELRIAQQSLWYPDRSAGLTADTLLRRLTRDRPLHLPLLVRLGCPAGPTAEQVAADLQQVVAQLSPHVAFFSLMIPEEALKGAWPVGQWREYILVVRQAAAARPLLLCLPADLADGEIDRLLGPAQEAGAAGVVVDGSVASEAAGRLLGPLAQEPALRLVRRLRESCGSNFLIIGAGGVHEPEDALRLYEAGADLVQIDSGLVYSGPGLPKRVNEALLYAGRYTQPKIDHPEHAERRPAAMAWFWTTLMGAGMLIGGLLALAIATTRVVLPYDESFVGMTRGELARINDRLLAFMAHDRVSLAGTMISIGVFYLGLSLAGIRRGLQWARTAVLASAFAGFGSFFLFLGFGYFDPFHAFVTAVLFQFLLLGLHSPLGPPRPTSAPGLREDWRWRWSQWGQLLFILQGAGLLGGGVVISTIGATRVFVREDLEFMGTTAEALVAANPRLVPLIAHDRASFGGMLIASGLTVLLTALWGYRRGARWLWWMLLAAGTPAYAAGIGVHLAVGYTEASHLLPAVLAAAMYAVALFLSYPFLCQRDEQENARLVTQLAGR
jgi:dihydroorotate dehydrogenase